MFILPINGSPISWTRGLYSSDIDHALVNSSMLDKILSAYFIDYPFVSDHKPLVVYCKKTTEFSIGFRWVFRSRCGNKFNACVAKAANMIEDDYQERCPCYYKKNSNPRLEHWFLKCYLFRKFRMKYFKDIEVLYEEFLIITSKYCPISNGNVITVVTDMNIESSTDSESSNKVYNNNNNNNNNNNRTNIINNRSICNRENSNIKIRDSANKSIVTNNVVNWSIDDNRVNISNFLNECVNTYVTWYLIYNFLLDGRDVDIIDLNYKKE